MCQRSTCSARGIFIDIGRGISEKGYQTSYNVRNLKKGNGWLFLCDTWLRYLKKLQFMLTETRQISNLRSQDVSKEILSDLVRKNVAEFKVFSISSMQLGKRVMYHLMLKLCFCHQHPHLCKVLQKRLPSVLCN